MHPLCIPNEVFFVRKCVLAAMAENKSSWDSYLKTPGVMRGCVTCISMTSTQNAKVCHLYDDLATDLTVILFFGSVPFRGLRRGGFG